MKTWRLAAALSGSSSAVLPAALIAVTGVLLAVVTEPTTSVWVGRAQNTASYATVFGFAIAGCLSVAAGFLAGSSLARDEHTLLRRGTRSVTSVIAVKGAGDLLLLWTGLLVALAAAFAATAAHGGGFRWDSWLAVPVACGSVAATYGSGLLAGALVRHHAALIVFAPLPYAATLWSSSLSLNLQFGRAHFLLGPFVDQSWFPGSVPDPISFAGLAAYVTGAALVFGSVTIAWLQRLHRQQPAGSGLRLLATAVTVLAAGHVLVVGAPNWFGRTNPAGVVCTASASPICLWADQAHQTPTWEAAARDVHTATTGLPVQPRRYVQTFVPLQAPEDLEVQTPHPQPEVAELRQVMLETRVVELLDDCPMGHPEAHQELWSLFADRIAGDLTPAEAATTYDTIRARCG
ncbi:hypothetical protein [Actinotalea sp. K2]|uniref:hypothetical protein n=1 Tax=Actinotalea sp. K2 TaxID=2939438 RepID=UPI0020176800|nr:hypothetical protein [Actinotalea sp. K2]MCL3860645.1 hypothetical protein [Actinotalea sp. K2]